MTDRPLRIGFVAYRGNMHCGGQGVYLWFLARELAKLGHCVDVFVGPPYPDPMPFVNSLNALPNERFWGKWFLKNRAALIPRPKPMRIFEPLNLFELGASWLGFLPEPLAFSVRAFMAVAARVNRGERYDIVHDVQCLGYGILGIRALGLPVVTTVHHPLSVDRRASFARDQTLLEALGTMTFYPVTMQAYVARRVDRLLTSSGASAREIERDFGVSPSRIRMVSNGVDTELFKPDSTVKRSQSEILCVGRADDPNKGVGTLIEALARLPDPVTLTLVDDDSPNSSARRRAQELGCGQRLHITGHLETDRLVSLYQRAALVVVPSRYEGFGLPAVEAMACGTPVVACDAGALREVVDAGGGILVERDNPAALARGIGELMVCPEARSGLGELGRKHVNHAFAWPRVARATAAVYTEVAEEMRSRRGQRSKIAAAARERSSPRGRRTR